MSDLSLLRDLISEAKDGNVDSFEHIVILHQNLVLRVAQHLLLNREDAQDAAQEVFLRLHRNLKRFQQEQDFESWLYRITVNICHDIRRRRKQEISLDDEALKAPATAPDAEAFILLQQQQELVIAALGGLSARERTAVVLRDLEGLSTTQVAAATGVSEATVRSQISSGRVKIRNYVAARMRRRSV